MASVVSLLPDEYTQRVQDLRTGLHDELGISTPLEGPPPHFTYQLAKRYDVDALQPVLERIAENEDSFTIRTNGVALFTDTEPVVYIPVTRNRQLTHCTSVSGMKPQDQPQPSPTTIVPKRGCPTSPSVS